MPSTKASPTDGRASAAGPRAARKPGRPRNDARGAEVREALLDAATALTIERGFEAVGLREIAERAGSSPAMISYYFGDREGLYEALFERAFERLSREVVTLFGSDGGGEVSLAEFSRVHVAALSKDPWVPQLIAREVLARDTHLRHTFSERVGEGPLRLMVNWIEDELAAGRLRADLDPQLTAMSIAALAVFPYLFAPILGPQLDIELNDEFRDRLTQHNQRLIADGTRARSGDPE